VPRRTVLTPYTDLFTVPGTRAFSSAGLLARVPMSTSGLGSVLLVEGESGSYALAGAVAGTNAICFALGSPQWARAMDRLGQGRVLRATAVLSLVVGLAFVTAVVTDAPHWTWFALAALCGGTAANVGSVVRSRWANALPEAGQRQTAFAFESVADELVFVVAPPAVTFLAALIAPPLGFLAGMLIGVVGALVLSRQQSTAPPVAPRVAGQRPVRTSVLTPGLVAIGITYLAVGIVFGAMDVVVVGFADEEGRAAAAGVALSAYAGGSLVAGLAYGIARLPGSLVSRFLGATLLFAAAAQALHLVGSLTALVGIAFLAGLTIAPVLVAGMSVVESRVPRAQLTEGLTWTSTGLTVGVTAGSALAGTAVDEWGAESAFAVPALGAALAGVLAVAAWLVLRRTPVPAGAPAHPEPGDRAEVDDRADV
jgi:MFS family permease